MKTLKFYFVFFALLFIQCKEKPAQKEIPSIKPVEKIGTAEDEGNIAVTVFNYSDKSNLGEVNIEIEKGGVSIGHDRTDSQGNVTLSAVDDKNEYIFSKPGFIAQNVHFMDYEKISKIDLYLKANIGPASPAMNVRGVVSNSGGVPINNAIVRTVGNIAYTQEDGSYSLNVQGQEGPFPLDYVQGSINGTLKLDVSEDSVMIDVFIDGFTNDSIVVKK